MARRKPTPSTTYALKPFQKQSLIGAAQAKAQLQQQLQQANQNYMNLGALILEGAGVEVERLAHFHIDGDNLIYELKENATENA